MTNFWEWVRPPTSSGVPTQLIERLSELVAQSGDFAAHLRKRREFLDRARDTLTLIAQPDADQALLEIRAIRRQWDRKLAYFHDQGPKKLGSEFEKYRPIVQELSGRFTNLTQSILGLAESLLEDRAANQEGPLDLAAQIPFTGEADGKIEVVSSDAPVSDFERVRKWQRVCLLAKGTVVRVPTVVVTAHKGYVGEIECEVFDFGSDQCVPHPFQVGVGSQFEEAANAAWEAARGLAESRGVTGMWFYENIEQSAEEIEGRSAGGALALGFYRALKGQKVDPLVVVIASMRADLKLGKVLENDIPAKIAAACENGEIDTIATVHEHVAAVKTIIEQRGLDDRIQVVDIADV